MQRLQLRDQILADEQALRDLFAAKQKEAANVKSWRTTMSGFMLGLGLLLTQVSFTVDEDPATSTDWEKVGGAALAVFGGLGLGVFARDNRVSSEDVGIKK